MSEENTKQLEPIKVPLTRKQEIVEIIGDDYKPSSATTKHDDIIPYNSETHPRIAFGCISNGLGVEDIKLMLGVKDNGTISRWKNKYPEFAQAFLDGQKFAAHSIFESAVKLAQGYTVKETKVFCTKEGNIVTHEVDKHYAPNAVTQIFLLKNLDPENWKDKRDVEHRGGVQLIAVDGRDEKL